MNMKIKYHFIMSTGYLTVGNYEDGFLTLKEQQILGNLNIASAAMYGMKNSQGFGNIFLNHPIFGQKTKLSPDKVKAKTGCDFCWFSFNFDNHLRFRNYSRVSKPGAFLHIAGRGEGHNINRLCTFKN